MPTLVSLTALVTSRNIIIICAALSLTTGAWYGGKYTGRSEQKIIYANDRAIATQTGVKAYGQINRSVKRLADPDLDAGLDKWMRD